MRTLAPDAALIAQLHKLPVPIAEYRFDMTRRWKFDFCWPDYNVALEIEGGIWTGGRHTRGAGFAKDIEKYNRAGELGYRVFRCQPRDVYSEATGAMLRRAMGIIQ